MGRYDVLLEQDEQRTQAETRPATPPRRKPLEATAIETTRPAQMRAPQPVPPVRPVRGKQPAKRVMKSRHPFDIYHDQYDSLKDLALQDRMQGGEGSMSAMVREALDAFIEKHKSK